MGSIKPQSKIAAQIRANSRRYIIIHDGGDDDDNDDDEDGDDDGCDDNNNGDDDKMIIKGLRRLFVEHRNTAEVEGKRL